MSDEDDEDLSSEQELRKALDTKGQGKKEDRQAYFQRLTKECKKKWWADPVSEESDQEWEDLTEPTQAWVNNAVTAFDEEKEIADFPDTESETKEDQEMSESTQEEADTKKKKKSGSTSSKKSDKKEKSVKSVKADGKAKPAKEKVEKPPKAMSPRQFIRVAVARDHTITQEALMAQLGKAGYAKISETAVSSMRTSALGMYKILSEEGKLKTKLKFD